MSKPGLNTLMLEPISGFAGDSDPVRRPKEFACFSYDANHKYRPDDSSMKWYYPPRLNADLSAGFDSFDALDEGASAEHIDSLLKTIMAHEQRTGQKIDAQLVTWRGIMTKLMSSPYEDRDGFELNATMYQDCIFIEEDHKARMEAKRAEAEQRWRGQFPREVMSYWGYKFETLSTLPKPWGETSREYIESREHQPVSNKEQYCSVVRTGIGKTIMCLGGEVDAIWDSKPEPGKPINWVELKTTAEMHSGRDFENFDRKLLKWWIQSFLLGVPKIVVGFRSRGGVLTGLNEMDTAGIPDMVRHRSGLWDGNVCINFCAAALAWIRERIGPDGVWRIRRQPKMNFIEMYQLEETGHGEILTDEFINWRIKLSMPPPAETSTDSEDDTKAG